MFRGEGRGEDAVTEYRRRRKKAGGDRGDRGVVF